MPDVDVRREHGLEIDEAKSKVKEIVADLERSLDVLDKVSWTSDTHADIAGKGFKGTFSVDERHVHVALDLRFFAKPLKGKIAETINKRIDSYFG